MVKHNKNFKSKKKQSLKKKALRKTKRKGGKKSKKGGLFEGRLCQSMSGLEWLAKDALNNILVAYSGPIDKNMEDYNNEHITFGRNGNVVIKEKVRSSQSTTMGVSTSGINFNPFIFTGGKVIGLANNAVPLLAFNKDDIKKAYTDAVNYLLTTSDKNFRFCYNIACAPKKFSFSAFKGIRQNYNCDSDNRKSIRLTINGVIYAELEKKFDNLLMKIKNYDTKTKTVLTNKQIEEKVQQKEAADEEKKKLREENVKIENNKRIMKNIDDILDNGNILVYKSEINELGCTKHLNIDGNNYGLDEKEASNHGWDLYYQYKDLNTGNVKTFLYTPERRKYVFTGKAKKYTYFKDHLYEVITENIVNAINEVLKHENINRPPNENIIITREIFKPVLGFKDSCSQ